MSEDQAKHWMCGLADSTREPLPDPDRIWRLAQLDSRFEARRQARATLVWLDAVVQSGLGLALAGFSLWLIGMVGH